MPFTFSHPAAVLPILALPQRWRSATGLIVGSMTPDFEKFIRMSTEDPYSHTWRSIFYFNLPLGLVLAFLFHLVIRDTLVKHSPVFVRQRFIRLLDFNWWKYFRKQYFVVVLSLLAGTISHILWDSFTHKDGRGVQLLPFLEMELSGGEDKLYLFEVLQTVSSVIGLAIILFFVFRLRKNPIREILSLASLLTYWVGLLCGVMAVLTVRANIGSGLDTQSLYHLSIPVISAGMISLIIVSLYFKIVKPH
ncbi:DUF4184 family protein [Rufibacter roseus]|uniref:DUF4184 family protein n=1 Tax=Rufibacter roseus TaxID=1567108 RepID=A0ABW2DLM2_9BACT|nr:DUF4184 family protein [Rufibacter roseus]